MITIGAAIIGVFVYLGTFRIAADEANNAPRAMSLPGTYHFRKALFWFFRKVRMV